MDDQPTTEANETPPKENSGEKRADNCPQHTDPSKTDEGLKVNLAIFDGIFAALELIALVLWMMAEIFHSNSWITYAGCLSLAGSFFLFGAAYAINNKLKRPRILFPVFSLLSAFFVYMVFSSARPHSTPRLSLSVILPGISASPIPLTNEALFVTIPKEEMVKVRITGNLVVPVPKDDTAIVLEWVVHGDPRLTADGLMVVFSFSNTLECSARESWVIGETSIERSSTLVFRDSLALYPGMFMTLPAISIKPKSKWPQNGGPFPNLIVWYESKNVPRQAIGFQLVGVPNGEDASLVFPTNGIFRVRIKP